MSNTLLNNNYNTWFVDQNKAYIGAFNQDLSRSYNFKFNSNMDSAFNGCSNLVFNLTKYANMFSNVNRMYFTFNSCRNIIGQPVCPDSVGSFTYAYAYCYNITGNPVCGNNAWDLAYTYECCYNLTGSPVCGPNVTDMTNAYNGCNNITGRPVVGDKVTGTMYAYANCSKLIGNPVITNNVRASRGMYMNCTGLSGNPVFSMNASCTDVSFMYSGANLYMPQCPEHVTKAVNLYKNTTFQWGSNVVVGSNVTNACGMYCNALSVTNAICTDNIVDMSHMYSGCSYLTYTVCGNNVKNMAYAYNGCAYLSGSPVCGPNVTNMAYAYNACNYLTGSPVCGPNVIDMGYAYQYCSSLTGSPVCGALVTNMDYTYNGCNNLIGNAVCGDLVGNMKYTYNNCVKLTGAACGINVKHMINTYYNCQNINEAVCGPNVTNMNNTYGNCKNLTKLVIGPAVVNAYSTYNNIQNLPAQHLCIGPLTQYMTRFVAGSSSSSDYLNMTGNFYFYANNIQTYLTDIFQYHNNQYMINVFVEKGSNTVAKFWNSASWTWDETNQYYYNTQYNFRMYGADNMYVTYGNYIYDYDCSNGIAMRYEYDGTTWNNRQVTFNTVSLVTGNYVKSVSGTFYSSKDVTAEATAPSGYVVEGWYNGTERVSYDNPYVFTSDADLTLTAKGIVPPPPLTFTAETAGAVISLNKMGDPGWSGSYSIDGTNWQTYTLNTNITLANVGDKVYFKGTQTGNYGIARPSKFLIFKMTDKIAASGSIMSLFCGDKYISATGFPYDGSGYSLFSGCSSNLTTPPALPATNLAYGCYQAMFTGCSGLTTVPALPATTLADRCYLYMFDGCTNLTTIPANLLPAKTLTSMCYQGMFNNCTNLTTPPALPATALSGYCYSYMFRNCTSLIVSDSSGSGYSNAWRIPASGTFTGTTYAQTGVFTNCATGSGRASDDMAGAVGSSYTYYTQNTPIVANNSNTSNVNVLN